jgi:hypothetical protein
VNVLKTFQLSYGGDRIGKIGLLSPFQISQHDKAVRKNPLNVSTIPSNSDREAEKKCQMSAEI